MSKGEPWGYRVWGSQSSLRGQHSFSVPWGKDMKSLLYCMCGFLQKKENFTGLSFKDFSLVLPVSASLWTTHFFFVVVFFFVQTSPVSQSLLYKTLCLFKSDMFVAATWQGGMKTRMMVTLYHSSCHHRSKTEMSLCPTLLRFFPSIAHIFSPLSHPVLGFPSLPH